jgi:hypothetical protein
VVFLREDLPAKTPLAEQTIDFGTLTLKSQDGFGS